MCTLSLPLLRQIPPARMSPVAILWIFLSPTPSSAQTQQPFLFATQGRNGEFTGIAAFVRNDQTGNLTEVPNSPFTTIHSTHCTISVIDPKGRFGYGACGLGAFMYSLAATGALEEVIGSPFAESTNTDFNYLAAESTESSRFTAFPSASAVAAFVGPSGSALCSVVNPQTLPLGSRAPPALSRSCLGEARSDHAARWLHSGGSRGLRSWIAGRRRGRSRSATASTSAADSGRESNSESRGYTQRRPHRLLQTTPTHPIQLTSPSNNQSEAEPGPPRSAEVVGGQHRWLPARQHQLCGNAPGPRNPSSAIRILFILSF